MLFDGMGPLRFELRFPAPQAGRMAKLPHRPKQVRIIVSIQKLILVFWKGLIWFAR